MPSRSVSSWNGLRQFGQLSRSFGTPSQSSSWVPGPQLLASSQASPAPSPFESTWVGFGSLRQLSQASPTPSVSVSSWSSFGYIVQLSQASPTPSPSQSC